MEAQSSQLAARILSEPATPLRLLIDGRKLGDGGIGVYVENLIFGVLATGGCAVTVIASEQQAALAAFRNQVNWHFDSARPYSIDELFLLSKRIPFWEFDVFHTPHYVLPFGIPIPSVITVHDLIHIKHPERCFYPYIAKRLISSSASRARAVIAVSRDTQHALVSTLGVEPAKLVHIPNAVSPILDNDGERTISSALSTENPYFLTVLSNIKPHKGLPDLIEAWRRFQFRQETSLQERNRKELVLVGYGVEAIRHTPALASLIERTPGVRLVGAVDGATLRHLYRWAHALIVPSLSEGFCLPALEAQACGAPVICRPVAAIKELITDRDLVARDFTINALEAVILQAADRERSFGRMSAGHLEKFSIQTVGTQLRDLYARIAAQDCAS